MKEIIKKVFFDDWKAKLFSLFLAFIIWLLLSYSDWSISEFKMTVPINFTDIPPDMIVFSTSTSSLEVYLEVPKRLDEELKKASPELNLNVSEFKVGQVIVPLSAELISNIPKGVKVSKIKPSSVVLNLDRLIEKTVAVEPIFVGEVKGKIDFSPKKVRVLCPSTLSSILKSIPTEPVDFLQLEKLKEISVPILIPEPRVTILGSKNVRIVLEKENP